MVLEEFLEFGIKGNVRDVKRIIAALERLPRGLIKSNAERQLSRYSISMQDCKVAIIDEGRNGERLNICLQKGAYDVRVHGSSVTFNYDMYWYYIDFNELEIERNKR